MFMLIHSYTARPANVVIMLCGNAMVYTSCAAMVYNNIGWIDVDSER